MKQIWPAPERNKDPILAVLQRVLPDSGRLLEIASGSGQHAAYFAEQLPEWQFFPSDLDPEHLNSINEWVKDAAQSNLHAALSIDVLQNDWGVEPMDAAFCANMIHIAPWACTPALLAGVGRHLRDDGVFVLYGPFQIGGVHTAPSNEAFDGRLKSRDPSWGVRNLDDVVALAHDQGLAFVERVAMPANNFTVVFRKDSTDS